MTGRPSRRLRDLLAHASLRVRVMATAAGLVTITAAVMGTLGTALLRGDLLRRDDTQLRAFSTLSSRLLTHPPRGFRPAAGSQLPTDFLVEIIDARGHTRVAPGSLHDVPPPHLSAASLHRHAVPFTAPAASDPGHSWRVVIRSLSGGRHSVIAISLDDVQNTVSQLEAADAVAGAAGIMLLAGIGLPLVRVSLGPLSKMEDTAEAIAAGDLSRRIAHPPAKTEVGRLATALNIMLGRIEAAYQAREEGEAHARDSEDRMRRFVADASHELRTPLTSVRGLAEFYLQQGPSASPAEVTRLMTGIQAEAARMGRLVDDLLLLAQFDEDPSLDRQPVDLSSIAATAVMSTRAIHPTHPVTLRTAPDPVIVHADSTRLRQIIDNLLTNAFRHTPAGTPVTVTVAEVPGYGELTVSDAGPGMTTQQAARVFDRFYRTDKTRSRRSGGAGLGLSIVAALTAAHHGSVTVHTAPGHGAAFRVRLPLAARAAPQLASP